VGDGEVQMRRVGRGVPRRADIADDLPLPQGEAVAEALGIVIQVAVEEQSP